ncbi:MAG TPA: gephyrin-like molybdotransferase Glp [Nevskiaceae bacterium]|nr:gephyrin-like molybdotransferase Glp [Nevskiaceae bacterium]
MKALSVEAALARLSEVIAPLGVETVPVAQALCRVTGAEVLSACDLPPFDQSAMDGYAVSTADVREPPTRLPLAATVAAGPHERVPSMPPAHACRIYTGGLIPQGADAVVRQEWTARDGDVVVIQRPTPVGQDIRRQGEELRKGTPLIEGGRRLNAGHIALLAMAGVAHVPVRRAPRIVVLVSGDEIVDAGQPLRPGEVFNANGPQIVAWLARAGYPAPRVEPVPDREAAVSDALARAFAWADLVLTTGGVSVGDRDLIAPEAEKLGAERLFWKVAQKPGKPVYVARRGACFLIGLPGNPASVLVNLAVFVRRALDRLEGLAEPGPAILPGRLSRTTKADDERETWLRVHTQLTPEGMLLHPQGHQASHMLSNLAQADALAWLPVSAEPLAAGTLVRWLSMEL